MAKTFRQIKNLSSLGIIFILLLAAFLRLWKINSLPPGPFGDEIDVGYQAYSILHTGRDYMGQLLPTYIHSVAEWRAPFFIYSAVPFVALFGLNEFGVRFSAVFFGILGILLLYLLVKELLSNQRVALLSAFVLAISPWHIHYSRVAFEVTLLISLFLAGVLFFIKGFKDKRFLLPAAVILALTPYTYSTASLFLPLLLLSILIIFKEKILKLDKKWIFLSMFFAFIVLLPFLGSLISGEASHRISVISIFSDPNVINDINIKRNEVVRVSEQLFHNKATAYTKIFTQNYLSAFSPQFLFLNGDPNPRQSAGAMGELYLIFLPLLLLGIWKTSMDYKKESSQLIMSWLIFSPIPSALTQGGGTHATRLFLMLPPLTILIGVGISQIFLLKHKALRIFSLTIIGVLLVIQVSFFLHQYLFHYNQESWIWWQVGYKEPMTYIADHGSEYDRIFLNNSEPSLVRFLFWTKYDPVRFQRLFTGDQGQQNILPGFDGFKLDKYYFGTLSKEGKLDALLDPKTLYLISQKAEVPGDWDWRTSPPAGVKVLMTSTSPTGSPLFYLVTAQ
ncbi:MAG: glycosyltransferase family 39 protein [bacterium]|nr:glycosyltransferase family 39 protein [bacterium]